MEEINWRKKFDKLVEKDAAEMAAQSARIEELTKALRECVLDIEAWQGLNANIADTSDGVLKQAYAALSPTPLLK